MGPAKVRGLSGGKAWSWGLLSCGVGACDLVSLLAGWAFAWVGGGARVRQLVSRTGRLECGLVYQAASW